MTMWIESEGDTSKQTHTGAAEPLELQKVPSISFGNPFLVYATVTMGLEHQAPFEYWMFFTLIYAMLVGVRAMLVWAWKAAFQ